jgi:hypothetical protein
MAEDKNENYVPLDLEELRLKTHKLSIEMPEAYTSYFTEVIEAIQMLEAERRTRLDLCADIARLQKLAESWKSRAEKHGCNIDDGDPDCG